MTETPQDDPFSKPLGTGPWADPAQPKAPPTPQGYAAPPPGYAAPPPGYATPPPTAPAAPTQPGYPPPGYSAPQQPGYPPAAYGTYGYAPQKKPKTWMNIVSLCAVGAALFIPLLANIAGIVFGHLGVRAADRGEADNRGVGMAGLILNYVFAVLWLLGIIAYIVFIAWAINECSTNPNGDFCGGTTY